MAYRAPGRHMHAGGIPGFRGRFSHRGIITYNITFDFENVKLLVEYAGIEK